MKRSHRRKLVNLIKRGERERARWLWATNDPSIDRVVRLLASWELDDRAQGTVFPIVNVYCTRNTVVALGALRRAARKS